MPTLHRTPPRRWLWVSAVVLLAGVLNTLPTASPPLALATIAGPGHEVQTHISADRDHDGRGDQVTGDANHDGRADG